MGLKRIIVMVMCVLLSSISYAKPTYNVDQLSHFNKTNECAGCDLSDADLSKNLNHFKADLHGANLSNSTVRDGNLNLSVANLQNTNLTGAAFSNCNFLQTDFTGAVLYGADLSGVNLYEAKITNEQLAEASSICGAILPDGSIGVCN